MGNVPQRITGPPPFPPVQELPAEGGGGLAIGAFGHGQERPRVEPEAGGEADAGCVLVSPYKLHEAVLARGRKEAGSIQYQKAFGHELAQRRTGPRCG